MTPLFSIIIPVYNAQQYLDECLKSILTQSYKDFEVLIINDGSNDQSGEICDKYATLDSRLKVFHAKNGGVSSARNIGLENARGEWICFVDSDDSVDEFWLEKYAENLNADVIFQGAVIIETWKTVVVEFKEYFVCGNDRDNVIAYLETAQGASLLNSTWSKCCRASYIKENRLRFLENCNLSEDLIFILQLLSVSSSLKVLSYSGYHYRKTNSTLTKAKHKPELLLEWKKEIINAMESYCGNDRNNVVFKSIAIKEFIYLSFYVVENIKTINATSGLTKEFYSFLRILRKPIYLPSLPFNRKIFCFMFLPDWLFTNLLFMYSSLYLFGRGVIKKEKKCTNM